MGYCTKRSNTNNIVYSFITLYLLLGTFFSSLSFLSFIDEISTLLIICYIFTKKNKTLFRNKEFYFFILIFIFYYIYSILYSANHNIIAITLDAFQQIKPFIAFYAIKIIGFESKPHSSIKQLSIFLACLSFIIYIISGPYVFFNHPANYGNTIFIFGLTSFYFSHRNPRDKKIFILILILGLLCNRSKYYAEFLIATYLLFFNKEHIKFNIKYLCILIPLGIIGYWIIESKFNLYLNGLETGEARTILYAIMPTIFIDYFPFGSGFASFATWFSGVYYSPLYEQYNIQYIYGISEDYYDFIADTYFPALAEFGIIGVLLFFIFWKKRYKEAKSNKNIINYQISVLIISYFLIESFAAPTFVTNYAIIPMIIIASTCNYGKNT